MQQIFNFFLRNKTFLLFIFLFLIALTLTIQSHSYHKSKFINSSNALSGKIYNITNSIKSYFYLKNQNKILLEENNNLKSILYNTSYKNSENDYIDSLHFDTPYRFIPVDIIKQSYSSAHNFLTINRGSNFSIKPDFGVITSNGVVGVVTHVSRHYSRIISILNVNFEISAQLKKTNHYGSLKWNGKSPHLVTLNDMSKLVPVAIGDTVVTSGLSTIFPKNIPIGIVNNISLNKSQTQHDIDVKLFNDMTNLRHIYVIEHKHLQEIDSLSNYND